MEFLGELPLQAVHPEDVPQFQAFFQQTRDFPGMQSACEYRLRHRHGNWVWLETLAVNYQHDPSLGVTIFLSRDISHYKVTQQAMQAQEIRFQEIANAISQLFFIRSSAGEFLYVSPAYEKIWGRTCASLYEDPNSWIEAIHPADQSKVYASVSHQFAGNEVTREYRIIRPDGELRWIFAHIHVVRDEMNQPLRFVGFATDISDRKQFEQALKASEERRRLAIDLNDLGFWEFQVATGDTIWNKNQYQLLGLVPGEIPAGYGTWRDRVHPEDRQAVEQALRDAMENRTDIKVEHRIVYPNGTIRWILLRGRGVYDETGKAIRMLGVMGDITDRKQAEFAMRESEEQLRQIFDHIQDLFFLKEIQTGKLIYVNPAYDQVYHQPQSVIYENPNAWLEQIHPEDRERIICKFNQQVKGEMFFEEEYRIVLPNGVVRWISDRSFPIRNEAGEIYRYAGICRDITKRKQTELSLRESEAKLRDVLNNAIAAIGCFYVSSNRKWEPIYYSTGYELIYGYPAEAFMSDANLWRSRIPVEDWNNILVPLYQEIFSEGSATREYRFQHKDGKIRWLSINLTSRRNQDDDGWIVTTVSVDITQRKASESALQQLNQELEARVQERTAALTQSEEKFRRLFEDAPIGIALAEVGTYHISNANQQFCEILGYSKDEALGLNLSTFTHPDDLALELDLIQQVQDMAIPRYQMEKRYFKKSGEMIWVQLTSTTIRDQAGKTLFGVGMVQDITARKESEEALNTALAEKTVLLKEVHHRVNNNLQIISSLLRLQAKTIQDPAVLAALTDARQRIQTMGMVHQRLYQHKLLARLDLAAYLRDLVHKLASSYYSTTAEIAIQMEANPLEVILDVAVPCGLILNELVTNAFKYAFPEGRSGTILIRLTRQNNEGNQEGCVLQVQDNGVGFPEAIDFRKTRSLGMQILCSLTQQLRGTVELDRANGTTFTITFPLPKTQNVAGVLE